MAKIPKNYRIDEDVDLMIRQEASRRTLANEGKRKVSDANVIEMAVRDFVVNEVRRSRVESDSPNRLTIPGSSQYRPSGEHAVKHGPSSGSTKTLRLGARGMREKGDDKR